MLRLISWVINTNGDREINDLVQIDSALITPADLETASEVVFINNSLLAPSQPEEADQQR